ncbi:MAG: HlyD family efflux transporter periplasmic adaptor subunit [Roseiarcus sp.]|uniref:HlyD family secretion protein n=1 Tax=Roseiarcus sp. TaxID=1969460 RepID=UPI003C24BAF1
MDKRTIIVLGVVMAVAAAFAVLWFHKAPAEASWQGYAEADFVKVGPTQQGLVTAVHVQRGDHVVKGAPLFDQDDAMDRAAVDQAAHLAQQARDQLANLQGPAKPTEIAQAEANLNDAIAARGKVQADLQRNETLLASGSATKQVVDQERADLASAEAKIAAAAAAVKQAQAPLGRADEIVAQASAVEVADAALAQARWRLAQRSVAAPVAGFVADVLARPGETLQAGAPIVSLLPPENIFIRFFVPEPSLAHVHPGDTVALTCDNCPPDVTGAVSFVSPQAEYTPPFIYSESTRAKFVFLAEARPKPDQAALFNPGQPVTVKPRAASP